MQLVILTAIHERHAVSAGCIAHLAEAAAVVSQSKAVSIRLAAVISPQDEEVMGPVLNNHNVPYLVHENRPVSEKWQAGLYFARDAYPDLSAVTIFGSDDFPTLAYLEHVIERLAADREPCFGPDRCWIYNTETGRMKGWKMPVVTGPTIIAQPVGAGRTFTRTLLEKVDWRLWNKPVNRPLDSVCANRLAKFGIRIPFVDMTSRPGMAVVDVKSPEGNLNPFDAIPGVPYLSPPATLEKLLDWKLSKVLAFGPDLEEGGES